MLSVAWGKRALPLLWLVRQGNKGHFSVDDHLSLLQQVRDLLPDCKELILLGDGEFDSCELQEYARRQAWQYVLRTAKNTLIEDRKSDSYPVGELYVDARTQYIFLEDCAIGKQRYGCVNVLAWHQKGYKDPIYLLSSLQWAKDIMDYYKQRWGIETLFGDLKSRGFNIHKTRIKNPEMLHNLLILVAIAFCLCLIMGQARSLLKDKIPKICRKDRLKSYSILTLGRKIIAFCTQNNICFYQQFCKTLKDYFCVRF